MDWVIFLYLGFAKKVFDEYFVVIYLFGNFININNYNINILYIILRKIKIIRNNNYKNK